MMEVTVIVAESVAEHEPFETVTKKVVVADGETFITDEVAPLLHE